MTSLSYEKKGIHKTESIFRTRGQVGDGKHFYGNSSSSEDYSTLGRKKSAKD